MKKILSKVFVRFFQFVFLLVFLIVGSVVFMWIYPNVVITPKTVQWLYHKQNVFVFDEGLPSDFKIDIQNQDFSKQSISIQASDFCFHLTDQTLHACVKKFQLSLVVSFEDFSIKLLSLGPIVLETTSVSWKDKVKENKSESKESKTNAKDFIEKYVSKDLKMDRMRVQVPQALIQVSDQQIKASVDLKGNPIDLQEEYRIETNVGVELENEPKEVALSLTADFNRSFDFNGDVEVKIGSGKNGPEIFLKAKHKGNLFTSYIDIFGSLVAKSVAPMISEIRVSKLHFQNKNKMSLTGNIGIELDLTNIISSEPSALASLSFDSHLQGKFKITQEHSNAPLAFNVEILPNEQYGVSVSALTKGQYHVSSKKLDLEIFKVNVKVAEFEKMVKKLHFTQMAIPAPINALQGSIELTIGKEMQGINPYDLPIVLKTNLSSVNQSLKVEGLGNFKVHSKTFKSHLTMKLNLNDIMLQLPALDPIRGLPNLTRDPRFVSKKTLKKEESTKNKDSKVGKFTMDIQIETPQKPIRLLYEHFNPSAQFRFTSHITQEKTDYAIIFEPFEVSYMKRDAKLKHFEIKNDPKSQELVMDGRFLIKKAGYNLYADITKETQETYIVLSSDPPLSEDDIISLILFNALSSELDGGSSDSVANTQTAITQKSIGFFSFFLLASTPVETVNYDPSTGTYSARVRLPGGFTGTVGSDWDKAQEVGLRRRLGGNWVISATVGTDVDGQSRQQSMIEWFYRY